MGTLITFDSNNKDVAKVNKLGITSYEHSDRKYEPQTQNTFAFQFLFDPGQVAYIATAAGTQASSIAGATKNDIPITPYSTGLAKINEILNVSMQGITSPTKNIAQIVIDFFNTQVKFAGKPTYSNANITINTLIGLGTKNVLSAWADMCLNDRTLAGGWARSLPAIAESTSAPSKGSMSDEEYLNYLFPQIGYKCDGILLECARDGSIVNQWDYIGMWISSFTPGNYTMSGSSSPSQVTATISVDQIRQSSISYTKEQLANRNLI